MGIADTNDKSQACYIIYMSTYSAYSDVSFIADQLTGTVKAHFLF